MIAMTSSPSDDAERWREFAAMAREVFDRGDAWAAERSDPEGVPVLFEGAEGWSTAPLRLACGKGRLALERGDVAGVVLALVEAGHAGRNLEIVERILASIERVGKERARHASTTRSARTADSDRKLLSALAKARPADRSTPNSAATWLRSSGHSNLSHRQLVRRLCKYREILETDVTFLRNAIRRAVEA